MVTLTRLLASLPAEPNETSLFVEIQQEVVLGLLWAEAAGKRFLYRTAASFVRLRGAVESKPLLETKEIMSGTQSVEGGVVVVGSYVPDSSAQLMNLSPRPGQLC